MMKNKFVTAALSVLIAFGLWIYVITVISPGSEDTYYNVPVVFEGETLFSDRGLMVTTQEIPTVTLKLSGNRSDLNKLNKDNITVKVKLSEIYEAGEQHLSYTVSYPGNVASNAVTVQSRYPDRIALRVERRVTKEVDVQLYYEGSVAADLNVDKENVVLDHEKVSITGPESIINQIVQARITVDLDGRSESFNESYRFQLCDRRGNPVDADQVTADVAEVDVTLKIQRVKEIPLVLTVIPGGGATDKNCEIAIDPLTIKVSGSDAMLESLTELNLGTIDLGALDSSRQDQYQIVVPTGITNLTGVTEATVTIKFPELQQRTFNVSRITLTNVPAGLSAELVTKALNVTVRGPKSLINKMTAKDVSISVDLSGAQKGTFTAPAQIVMGAGYADVGAMGTYSVTVSLEDGMGALSDDPNGPST